MAYPASQSNPARGLDKADERALIIKSRLTELNAESVAGPVDRHRLVRIMGLMDSSIILFNQIAAIPGIEQYARDQKDDQGLDVVVEYTAMVVEITALRDEIFTSFPKDAGSGAWLVQSFDAAGIATELAFTTVELNNYRASADAVIATIS